MELNDYGSYTRLFNRAYERLVDYSPNDFVHMKEVYIVDAVSLSKAHTIAESSSGRGNLYTFDTKGLQDDFSEYGIIIHGEYGYATLFACPNGKLRVNLSDHYRLNAALRHLAIKAEMLLVRCIINQLSGKSILQWFDSAYRLMTNRRVSPNFVPEVALDKLAAGLNPGLDLMESRYADLFTPSIES